jgi:hypothetical protein
LACDGFLNQRRWRRQDLYGEFLQADQAAPRGQIGEDVEVPGVDGFCIKNERERAADGVQADDSCTLQVVQPFDDFF